MNFSQVERKLSLKYPSRISLVKLRHLMDFYHSDWKIFLDTTPHDRISDGVEELAIKWVLFLLEISFVLAEAL